MNVEGRVRWLELLLAAIFGALFTAFQFLSGQWCEPTLVRPVAGIFVVLTAVLYLYFVDDERRPLVGVWHRMLFGAAAGFVVAAISNGPSELYALLTLVGAMLGYVGFRWLKHVPI